ncbi:MAG: purine-nucleoside phosphorylase [Alphaproteobacteria bacterium]|nr:purine-nucleoside phosphorylase [Alphaproteobacteria bacterium]
MTELYHSFTQQIKMLLNDFQPEIALILGSGLGEIAEKIENPITIKYSEIAGFPQSTVSGHKGQFICGKLNNKNVICMQGRIHLYEGHSAQSILQIVKTFKMLGVKKLIVTNAAGSLNKDLPAGSIMMITDHINLSGHNPLIGSNDDNFGPRFPDISNAYSKTLQDLSRKTAKELNITLSEGVYIMVSGPNFETAAEVRAFGLLGGNAVGMSTVPEVISAAYCNIETLGFSVITNLGAGLQKEPLSHNETLSMANNAIDKLSSLINNIFKRI